MAPAPYSGQIDLVFVLRVFVGGSAEPQECSGLSPKSLTNTQRQLRSLLPLGHDQSSTAVDLDEATEVVWLSSQE